MFTLGQAAREVGVGKATISRAIHSGRLSANRNDTGGWSIDPAELYRVWSPANRGTVPATARWNDPQPRTNPRRSRPRSTA